MAQSPAVVVVMVASSSVVIIVVVGVAIHTFMKLRFVGAHTQRWNERKDEKAYKIMFDEGIRKVSLAL